MTCAPTPTMKILATTCTRMSCPEPFSSGTQSPPQKNRHSSDRRTNLLALQLAAPTETDARIDRDSMDRPATTPEDSVRMSPSVALGFGQDAEVVGPDRQSQEVRKTRRKVKPSEA